MEKFQKAYDSLKSGGTLKKKDVALTSKEKISYCQAITESVQSQQFKLHADFTRQFSAAFDLLFSLCEDSNLDVRVYVDECLNSIIRSNISEDSVVRIHYELYQEIKRIGPARCLRSALLKFAELVHHIRPNRCRTFAKNLVPCFINIVRRPEETIQECLGTVVERIFTVLGRFFSDEETKTLIKSFLPNLQLQSAVSRRTAALFLVELCRSSRKRYVFVSYLFKALLDTLVPVQVDQSHLQLLGTFFTLRLLIPILKACEDDDDANHETRVTQTGTIKLRPLVAVTTEHLLQVYEALLYYMCYPHSSVVTAALETLNQLLLHCPRGLLQHILSETEGIGKSRIFLTAQNIGTLSSRSRKGSFSGVHSGSSSLRGSQTDLSTLMALGDLAMDEPIFPNTDSSSPIPISTPSLTRSPNTISDDINISENVSSSRVEGEEDESQLNASGYSSIRMGQLLDDPLSVSDTATSIDTDNESGRKRGSKGSKQLESLNIPESISNVESIFSDPTSPTSPCIPKDIGFPSDIGSLTDTLPALGYCGRLICRKFLLDGENGQLIVDKDVRVSHKVLALGCLEAVCNLYPGILEDSLFPLSPISQRISDVLLFSQHDDPQIKGNIATLASTWLKAATIRSGRRVAALPQDVTYDAVQAISATLVNESAVSARLAVIALGKCYSEILEYDASTGLKLLRQGISLAGSPYWLLKVSVAELLSEIEYTLVATAEQSAMETMAMEEEKLYSLAVNKLTNVLMADEDHRVRQAAAIATVGLVQKLSLTSSPSESSFIRHYEHLFKDFEFSWHLDEFPSVHCLAPDYKLYKKDCRRTLASSECVLENLTYLIDVLVRTMCQAVDKEHTIGCLTALERLSDQFPPSMYEPAWCIASHSKAGYTTELLSMLFSMLKSVSFGADTLTVHQTLFSLMGSLFAGASLASMTSPKANRKGDTNNQANSAWPTVASTNLGEFANELFNYCLRIISIYWHVVTEQTPAPPPILSKAPMPQLPQASSLTTPVANKIKAVTGGKIDNRNQETNSPAPAPPALPSTKFKAADFYSSIHFMRIFEMVKGAWSNYRIRLEMEVEEKFSQLLRSCLQCLNNLFEVASFSDVERFTEELLAYLKPLLPFLPGDVVTTVVQLLKSLFGTNLTLLFQSLQSFPISTGGSASNTNVKIVHVRNSSTVYETCILKQRTKFFSQISSALSRHENCAELIKQHVGWFGIRGERHVMSLLKNSTQKSTLTNYIRLFEPIVVQGLRLYTSCANAELQCAVIGLLSQLVQIRVNYALLDTDRRFLDFLCQQLESIEEGHVRNLDRLVRKLFEFFVLLSYEKYQSVAVMEVPKILQLADGLLASSQNGKGSGSLGLHALHSVILDLYFFRSGSKTEAAKELEIQQEVTISMLLKCIRCGGGAVSLLSLILYQCRKDSESKWRKLSRDIVDTLLPLYSKNQVSVKTSEDLSRIFALTDLLCARAFRPVDPLLSLMLTAPPTSSTTEDLCNWLACELWCLRSLILYSNEAAITSRLEELPSAVVGATWIISGGKEAEFVDPLGSTLRKDFEETFARLLLSILKMGFEWLSGALIARPTPPIEFLEQMCHYYINMMIHICQSRNYAKLSLSMSTLLQSNVVTMEESIARSCPVLAVQWFYLLSNCEAYSAPCWKVVSMYGISPVLRRCVAILYCDYIKQLLVDSRDNAALCFDDFISNNSDIFDWYDEPPVNELLHIALNKSGIWQIALSKVADSLLDKPDLKPIRAMKLLQCLETANESASGTVLDISTRFIAECDHLSLAKMAGTLALRRLDLLMVNRVENWKSELSLDVLRNFMCRLDASRRRRFGVLYHRLEQLAKAWYPDEYDKVDETLSRHSDDLSEMASHLAIINPLSSPSKFSRVKFLEFLQTVLRTERRNVNPCVEALCFLSLDDVTEVLADEKTNPRLLAACLNVSNKEVKTDDTRNQLSPSRCRKLAEIADAARRCLLGAIRTVLNSVPNDFEAKFTSRDYSIVGDCKDDVGDRILDLTVGVHQLFTNVRLRSTLTESELRLLICYLVVTATVSLKWLDRIKLNHGQRLARVFNTALCNEHFCRVLACTDFIGDQLKLIGGSFWLCYKALNVKELIGYVEDLPFTVEDCDLRVAWQYSNACLQWIDSKGPKALPQCEKVAKDLFVSICRFPCVTSFTHVPPLAFKFGWTPELKQGPNGHAGLPTVPVYFLQNVETLREFIFRVNLLGWSSRQQFEEIWMGLLGVLSATAIGHELLANSVQETEERVVASSLAVRCLSSLLLQTLLSPIPGNPVASVYVFKPREKQSTFLKTIFGAKLYEFRRRLRLQASDINSNSSCLFGFNPERVHNFTKYYMGQLSVETLWSLTGILAEERDLVQGVAGNAGNRISEAYEAATTPETPDQSKSSRGSSFVSYADELIGDNQPKSIAPPPEEFMAVRRSTSNFLLVSESGLDLVSCLHFLLDLFTHWFTGGPDDIPLVLLSATVESVVYLSDLFSERAQYVWLRERLISVYQNRQVDDELILQDVLLGLMKCSAVLGINDAEKQKEMTVFIDVGLHNPQLSVRLATVHGVLYVLQTLTADEAVTLTPLVTEYVLPHISLLLSDDVARILEKPQSLEHKLAVWALGFYIVETFHDSHTKASFATKFTELCFKALQNENTSVVLLDCVINGLESVLVGTSLDARLAGQLTKLATESVQKPSSPKAGVLAIELLLTCLYTSKENQRVGNATTPDSEMASRTAGEPHISAMERLTVLLTRVTGGSRLEASAIGNILPEFLADHFSPSDVMNKVIIELLNPLQPHPPILIRALHSLIDALLQQEVPAVVCDWVLVSLPSFTCKNPAHFSIWALTCLLLSASTKQWVKALWPLAMSRYNSCESELDCRLFCFAIKAFRAQLNETSQIDTLLETIRKAAEKHPHSAYTTALENILNLEKQQEGSSMMNEMDEGF